MKDYDKALETYQAGLKHDPKNPELLDGVARYDPPHLVLLFTPVLSFLFIHTLSFADVSNKSTRPAEET